MAGARLGFGIASPALIRDLDAVKYSTNPYNVNSVTAALGLGTLSDPDYTRENCKRIMESRAFAMDELRALGFEMTPSRTNFIFVRHPRIAGDVIYTALRERGILVRHFTAPRISDYNRITVGSRAEMESLVAAMRAILEEHQ
jgi:histidinol-phosphate aminotransferase